MKTLHLVLMLVLIAARVHGQDGSVQQAEQQKKGVDLLTATVMHDGHGGVMYIEFKPADLRERHLHLLCEVVTDGKQGTGNSGSEGPKDMITITKEGLVTRGELFSFAGDYIVIHAHYPDQPKYYKTATIAKKDVKYITFPVK